jgi:hypothetical protein
VSAPNAPVEAKALVRDPVPTKYAPDQHLFNQLVVSLAGGMMASGFNISRVSPATAKDIATAAKNLADAIVEVGGGVRR